MNYQTARNNMVEQQVRPWDVLDQRVLDTFSEISRENFLSDNLKRLAYADTCLPIGYGQKTLNPNTDGRMLQSLALEADDQVLEIGTGSGFFTACLASLCRHVESIEIIPELCSAAKNRLSDLGISNFSIQNLDGSKHRSSSEQYNAIVLCGSLTTVPESYKTRLAISGRLFYFKGEANSPVHEAILLTRISETEWSEESLFETWVEPLLNF